MGGEMVVREGEVKTSETEMASEERT